MLRLRARKGTSLRSIFHSCEAERCLSLASFRFPWFKSPSESADSKSTVPAAAKKPGRAVASRHKELPYPLVPRSAQFDFPIKVHEEYQADSVSRGQWNYQVELKALCARLRFPVKHELILDVALTHPSFDEVRKPSPAKIKSTRFRQSNNSALLRSGHAATTMFVLKHLYDYFPNLPAEGMNELKCHLLNPVRLATIVRHLGMYDMIHRSTLLVWRNDMYETEDVAGVFYAVVGAFVEAKGTEAAKEFVHDYVIAQLHEENLDDAIVLEEAKLMLRALLREQHKPAPVARLLNEASAKTEHSVYHIAVYCGNTIIGKGFGRTPESGEEEACRDALRNFFLAQLTTSSITAHKKIASKKTPRKKRPSRQMSPKREDINQTDTTSAESA